MKLMILWNELTKCKVLVMYDHWTNYYYLIKNLDENAV